MRHIMSEAAIKMQHAWRWRAQLYSPKGKMQLHSTLAKERGLLRKDLVEINELREDLRTEALAFFEIIAQPLVTKQTRLKRLLQNSQYAQLKDAAVEAGAQTAAGGATAVVAQKRARMPRGHTNPMISNFKTIQAELLDVERALMKLQTMLLKIYYGPKEGALMASACKADPAGTSRKLMKANANKSMPSELDAFTHTMAKAMQGDDQEEEARRKRLMRRRMLLAAVKAAKPLTPLELTRVVRGAVRDVDITKMSISRAKRVLQQLATGSATQEDLDLIAEGDLAGLLARIGKSKGASEGTSEAMLVGDVDSSNADGDNAMTAGDALARALDAWLPTGTGGLLGLEPAENVKSEPPVDQASPGAKESEPNPSSTPGSPETSCKQLGKQLSPTPTRATTPTSLKSSSWTSSARSTFYRSAQRWPVDGRLNSQNVPLTVLPPPAPVLWGCSPKTGWQAHAEDPTSPARLGDNFYCLSSPAQSSPGNSSLASGSSSLASPAPSTATTSSRRRPMALSVSSASFSPASGVTFKGASRSASATKDPVAMNAAYPSHDVLGLRRAYDAAVPFVHEVIGPCTPASTGKKPDGPQNSLYRSRPSTAASTASRGKMHRPKSAIAL